MTAMLNGRKRIKPVNAKRKAENWKRAYGSGERVEWVKQLNCVACGRTPCENAHTANGGVGRKADADSIVPLCSDTPDRMGCHSMLHKVGRKSFERAYDVNLTLAAAAIEERWQAVLAGGTDLAF